jgi:hypothetical protein
MPAIARPVGVVRSSASVRDRMARRFPQAVSWARDGKVSAIRL